MLIKVSHIYLLRTIFKSFALGEGFRVQEEDNHLDQRPYCLFGQSVPSRLLNTYIKFSEPNSWGIFGLFGKAVLLAINIPVGKRIYINKIPKCSCCLLLHALLRKHGLLINFLMVDNYK